MRAEATPGAKMIYPIKHKSTTPREALVMHGYANHMPEVIRSQKDAAATGKSMDHGTHAYAGGSS